MLKHPDHLIFEDKSYKFKDPQAHDLFGPDPKAYSLTDEKDNTLSIISHKGSYGGEDGLWEVLWIPAGDTSYNAPPPPHSVMDKNPMGWLTQDEIEKLIAAIFPVKLL